MATPVLVSRVSSARPAAEVLGWARGVAEPAHRAAVNRLPGRLRQIVGYHAGWWDADGRPSGGGGKAVRPALTLAAARATGGDGAAVAAIPAGVAVELVHDFSLLHDDIMDGDPIRRHRPAAWTVFGVGETLLAGDAALALALDVLADQSGLRVLTGALLGLCSGQSADLAFETRSTVTLDECVQMAAGKTGALLAAACQLGAISAGAPADQAEAFGGFGHHLGMAFQLVDDLLGIWGDPAVTGKPVFSDLASRKKSLPVVAALTSETSAGKELVRLYQGADPLDEAAMAWAAYLIKKAGAQDWAQREADAHLSTALDCLERADPVGSEATDDLLALAKMMARRDH
jgi:geranylgeranyl diphosphate synthase type I